MIGQPDVPSAHAVRALLLALYNAADLHTSLGEADPSLNLLQQASDLAESLEGDGRENVGLLRIRARLFLRLGDYACGRDDLPEAEDYCQKALDLARLVVDSYPDEPENLRFLTQCLRDLGQVRLWQGDRANGLKCLEETLAILSDLAVRFPNYEETSGELAAAYAVLGEEADCAADAGQVLAWLKDSEALYRRLSNRYPDDLNLLLERKDALERLRNHYHSAGDFQLALEYGGDLLRIGRRTADRFSDDVPLQIAYADDLRTTATLLIDSDDVSMVLEVLNQALDRLLAIGPRVRQNVDALGSLVMVMLTLSRYWHLQAQEIGKTRNRARRHRFSQSSEHQRSKECRDVAHALMRHMQDSGLDLPSHLQSLLDKFNARSPDPVGEEALALLFAALTP